MAIIWDGTANCCNVSPKNSLLLIWENTDLCVSWAPTSAAGPLFLPRKDWVSHLCQTEYINIDFTRHALTGTIIPPLSPHSPGLLHSQADREYQIVSLMDKKHWQSFSLRHVKAFSLPKVEERIYSFLREGSDFCQTPFAFSKLFYG